MIWNAQTDEVDLWSSDHFLGRSSNNGRLRRADLSSCSCGGLDHGCRSRCVWYNSRFRWRDRFSKFCVQFQNLRKQTVADKQCWFYVLPENKPWSKYSIAPNPFHPVALDLCREASACAYLLMLGTSDVSRVSVSSSARYITQFAAQLILSSSRRLCGSLLGSCLFLLVLLSFQMLSVSLQCKIRSSPRVLLSDRIEKLHARHCDSFSVDIENSEEKAQICEYHFVCYTTWEFLPEVPRSWFCTLHSSAVVVVWVVLSASFSALSWGLVSCTATCFPTSPPAAAGSTWSLQSTRLHRTLKCYQGQHSRMQVVVALSKSAQKLTPESCHVGLWTTCFAKTWRKPHLMRGKTWPCNNNLHHKMLWTGSRTKIGSEFWSGW